jgi:hypothetical protein
LSVVRLICLILNLDTVCECISCACQIKIIDVMLIQRLLYVDNESPTYLAA